jgi:hypothetical protein
MIDGPARRPEHSDSMSDESARLEALLQTVPIFAALERVELARLVQTQWLNSASARALT